MKIFIIGELLPLAFVLFAFASLTLVLLAFALFPLSWLNSYVAVVCSGAVAVADSIECVSLKSNLL